MWGAICAFRFDKLLSTDYGSVKWPSRLRVSLKCDQGGTIGLKVIVIFLLIAAGAMAYYRFVCVPRRHVRVEVAYVIPRSLAVVDTPAEVRSVIETVKNGDRVEVLGRTTNWVHVRLASGRIGWLEGKDLLDAETFQRGESLHEELKNLPPQAAGHTASAANLHLEPSRDAPQLTQLLENQRVEVFKRRSVERSAQPGQTSSRAGVREAWYLVRAGSRAGWMLGRLVDLDVPQGIAMYAQGVNLVAWLVLNTVSDSGRSVPQYLVADRIGTQEFDFNHIRVFTWWRKHQQYVTAYVVSNLNGYFPIRVTHGQNVPYFRLRVVGSDGHKFQEVYGLFDTIVRPLGIVEGWESDAMPTRPAPKSRASQRTLGAKRPARRVSRKD